jgi:hypothetical protein
LIRVFVFVTIQPSGFELKKQVIFVPSSLFFGVDAQHWQKKMAEMGAT